MQSYLSIALCGDPDCFPTLNIDGDLRISIQTDSAAENVILLI